MLKKGKIEIGFVRLMSLPLIEEINILLRLLIAILLSGVLGWERESAGKSAGLRTHMLVGFSSALFVAIGGVFILKYKAFIPNPNVDPLRIIEAVVTGISFLGAGMIFVTRDKEQNVNNLTTAASILCTAGIGMTVGLGEYVLALGGTFILLIILRIVRLTEHQEN